MIDLMIIVFLSTDIGLSYIFTLLVCWFSLWQIIFLILDCCLSSYYNWHQIVFPYLITWWFYRLDEWCYEVLPGCILNLVYAILSGLDWITFDEYLIWPDPRYFGIVFESLLGYNKTGKIGNSFGITCLQMTNDFLITYH